MRDFLPGPWDAEGLKCLVYPSGLVSFIPAAYGEDGRKPIVVEQLPDPLPLTEQGKAEQAWKQIQAAGGFAVRAQKATGYLYKETPAWMKPMETV